MSRGAVTVVLAVVLLAAVALVAVAKAERTRHADRQNDGIERVHQAVGELDGPTLAGFRFLSAFQCLIYSRGGVQFALELCVDWEGRVVEGIDRRGEDVQIWSLREDPDRARVRIARTRFERVIEQLCVECRAIFERARAGGSGQPRR
jgi:hypothetical protein